MYRRASGFINFDRYGAFAGTGLEVKSRPGSLAASNLRLPANITVEERDRLGRGERTELAFLDKIQAEISSMVKRGVKTPAEQAALLNEMEGYKPFKGIWTARLVVMFFQRQDERRKADASLKDALEKEGAIAVNESTKGAVRRTAKAPKNPVISPEIAEKLALRLSGHL